MSGGIQIHVRGLSELHAQLRALPTEAMAVSVLARAARKAMLPVLEDARRLAPPPNEATGATGLTRDSIRLSVRKPRDGRPGIEVGLKIAKSPGRSAHWRWHYIELGTATQRARPFLRPALENNTAKVLQLLRAELSVSIDKTLKRWRAKDLKKARAA